MMQIYSSRLIMQIFSTWCCLHLLRAFRHSNSTHLFAFCFQASFFICVPSHSPRSQLQEYPVRGRVQDPRILRMLSLYYLPYSDVKERKRPAWWGTWCHVNAQVCWITVTPHPDAAELHAFLAAIRDIHAALALPRLVVLFGLLWKL